MIYYRGDPGMDEAMKLLTLAALDFLASAFFMVPQAWQ
jgi:hypothetical protein